MVNCKSCNSGNTIPVGSVCNKQRYRCRACSHCFVEGDTIAFEEVDDFVPSIKVIFCLEADEFNLNQVTERMELIPSEVRTRDSFPTEYYVKTIWSLEIIEENCEAVSIVFEKLLDSLKGKEEIIRNICDDYDIEAGFVVVIHCQDGDNPEIVLPREIISFAAAINAEIGFDLYCYE